MCVSEAEWQVFSHCGATKSIGTVAIPLRRLDELWVHMGGLASASTQVLPQN
jgi:hypothetical protein